MTSAIAQICAPFRRQSDKSSHLYYTLESLSKAVFLSPRETLEQLEAGNLLCLKEKEGLFLFSSSSVNCLRDRTINFIASEIEKRLRAVGADEDRIEKAVLRGLCRQLANVENAKVIIPDGMAQSAIKEGKKRIAQKGSIIWQALRGIDLD